MDSYLENSGCNIQLIRKIVQYGFLIMVILIGIQFTLFVGQLETGRPTIARPPGIEAFLPISSLISLKYWFVSGNYNRIHPSGILILLAALATAVVLKRGFCSWVCPFGLLTEYLNRLHSWIFRRKGQLPRWLDYPLRSLKYLLLLFFLWANRHRGEPGRRRYTDHAGGDPERLLAEGGSSSYTFRQEEGG